MKALWRCEDGGIGGGKKKEAIEAIYAELQKKRKHVDNTDLMVEINGILGDYIFVEEQKPGQIKSTRWRQIFLIWLAFIVSVKFINSFVCKKAGLYNLQSCI